MKKKYKKRENKGELSQMVKNCKDSNQIYTTVLENRRILDLNSLEKNA